MEKRLFVIGERDTILGFSLVGVDGFATDDPDAAAKKLDEVRRDPDIGIVLLTASVSREMRTTIDKLTASAALPIILEIPDRLTRPERVPLRELVRRALGIRI